MNRLHFTTCSIMKDNSPMKSNDGPHNDPLIYNSKVVLTSMPCEEMFTTSVSTESNTVDTESDLLSPAVCILYVPPLIIRIKFYSML